MSTPGPRTSPGSAPTTSSALTGTFSSPSSSTLDERREADDYRAWVKAVTGWSPRADWGSVAVQDLGPVFVPGRGGAVGVQDQGPAPPVDDDLVVEPAKKHAVLDGRRAAVGLVLGVVHLARLGGLVAPACPLPMPVPQGDGVAEAGGRGLGGGRVRREEPGGDGGAEL